MQMQRYIFFFKYSTFSIIFYDVWSLYFSQQPFLGIDAVVVSGRILVECLYLLRVLVLYLLK